jgi:hypothetical protein
MRTRRYLATVLLFASTPIAAFGQTSVGHSTTVPDEGRVA